MRWFNKIDKKEIYKYGLGAGVLEITYVFLVANFMNRLDQIMSQTQEIIGIIFMLLLFVFSAAVSGFLVLGYPAYLALEKRFKESFMTLAVTILTLFVGGIIIFTLGVLIK